jgi:hypothetical protein
VLLRGDREQARVVGSRALPVMHRLNSIQRLHDAQGETAALLWNGGARPPSQAADLPPVQSSTLRCQGASVMTGRLSINGMDRLTSSPTPCRRTGPWAMPDARPRDLPSAALLQTAEATP